MTSSNDSSNDQTTDPAEIVELVALQLGVAEVRLDDRLAEDLGAESADVMNLVATLEDRYRIEVEEEELAELRTVRDLHALARRERP